MWDWINISARKAAKPYTCAEGGGEIAKGEQYSYTAGSVEGHFECYRLCMRCAALAAAYCSAFDEEGFPLGELRQTLREEHGVADIDAWLATVQDAQAKAREATEQRNRRVAALGAATICDRCQATLATYGTACTAALDDRCPGFMAIEAAKCPPEGVL
jgi:hypothetical protein